MLKRKIKALFVKYKKIIIGILILMVIIIGVNCYRICTNQGMTPQVVWETIIGKTDTLKQAEGRTNIVLLGVGGQNHDGGQLTDTIILVSIDLNSKDVFMLSIPRDIWIDSYKDKINAAFAIGAKKDLKSGFVMSKATIEEVVGIPIHYGVLLDFEGFKNLVDAVGGVDINVLQEFTDNLYPIAGKEEDLCNGDVEYKCRYETVTFAKGVEHMNGDRALKYVRSRHAEGDAGTDFSRGKRQQQVLLALKNKLITVKTLANFNLFKNLINKAVQTDMSYGEMLVLGRKIVAEKQDIRSYALVQDEPAKNIPGLLTNPPLWQYNNRWVLTPKSGDFKTIHQYTTCLIENVDDCGYLLK